jgi:hypothetical protein
LNCGAELWLPQSLGAGSGRERKKAPILFEAFFVARALLVAILTMDDFLAV